MQLQNKLEDSMSSSMGTGKSALIKVDHAKLSAQTISRDELKDMGDIVDEDNGTFVVKDREEPEEEEELDTGTFVMKD